MNVGYMYSWTIGQIQVHCCDFGKQHRETSTKLIIATIVHLT